MAAAKHEAYCHHPQQRFKGAAQLIGPKLPITVDPTQDVYFRKYCLKGKFYAIIPFRPKGWILHQSSCSVPNRKILQGIVPLVYDQPRIVHIMGRFYANFIVRGY